MSSFSNMKERLVRSIGLEVFRRNFGPGWNLVAAQIAENIIADLGLVEIEASQFYPAKEPLDIEPHVEKCVRMAFAHKLVSETPMALTIERGKSQHYPGKSRMSLRGWIITRSAPHD